MRTNKQFWESIAGPLRRAMGFSPTAAEIEAELATIEAEPMSDSEVREVVEAVMHCRLCDHCAEMAPYVKERWHELHGDGCIWHVCPACRRREYPETLAAKVKP